MDVEVARAPSPSPDGLVVEQLSKRYGEVQALDRLSLAVGRGEIVGFVGSNGAGKTTAMRIILGVLTADSGTVRLGGEPVNLATRRRIGYMPEERGLYPRMKVGPQLAYLARLHGLTPAAAAEAVARWTERLGIAGRVDDDVQKLSLGNQQRVQLAAALVHDPDVLVLDEPFSGLDPVAVDVMSRVLREAADRGVPVLFSSHQLDLVERLCDRVAIVQSGRLVDSGRVADLQARGPRRYRVDGVDGVRIVELAEDEDDQAVLRAALAAGPVREFGPVRSSLTDLFRHVVAGSAEGSAEESGDESAEEGSV